MSNFKLHNRFDIEVHNVKTGEVKNYTHYNIVLDRLYSGLFRLSYLTKTQWCSSIVYGEGTGEVSPSRTTLFTPIAAKSTTNTKFVINSDNLSGTATYQIVIEPNEAIGKNISEVGFGSTSGAYTHSLIKDAQGNPISIHKTEYDKIVINATVFAELKSDDVMVSPPTSDNSQNMFIKNMLGKYNYYDGNVYITTYPNTVSPICTNWTAFKDNSNRSCAVRDGVVYPVVSMNSSQHNGMDIRSIQVGGNETHNYGSNYYYPGFIIPITMGEAFQGVTYNNIEVGTGNGVETKFNLPINIRGMKDCTVKVNDSVVNDVELVKIEGISKCVGNRNISTTMRKYGEGFYISTFATINSSTDRIYYGIRVTDIKDGKVEVRYSKTLEDFYIYRSGSNQEYYFEPVYLVDKNILIRCYNGGYYVDEFDYETGTLGARIGTITRGSYGTNKLYRLADTDYIALISQGSSSTSYPNKLYKIEDNELVFVKNLQYVVTETSSGYANKMKSFSHTNPDETKGDLFIGSSIYRFNFDTLEFEKVASGLQGGVQIKPFVRAEIVDHIEDSNYNQLIIYKFADDFSLSETIKLDYKFEKHTTNSGYKGIQVIKENLFIVHSNYPYIVRLNDDDTITVRCNKSNLFSNTAGNGYGFPGGCIEMDGKLLYPYQGFLIEAEEEVAEIKFNTPPSEGDVITIDYTLDFIPKNDTLTATIEAKMVWG